MGMSEKPPLSDSEVYERLHEAWAVLANTRGETKHGDAALRVARHMLVTLEAALVKKMDAATDRDGPLSPQPSDQQ